jgi:hypothetical protein
VPRVRVLLFGFFFSTRSARGARTKITPILGKNHARVEIIDLKSKSQAPARDFAYLVHERQQLGVHPQRAPHRLEHRAHAVLVLPRAWCSRSPQRTPPRCCALATHLLQFPNFHFSPLIVFCRSAVVFKNSLFCATSDSITCLATTLVSLMP